MLSRADDQESLPTPDVRALVNGRLFNPNKRYEPYKPYRPYRPHAGGRAVPRSQTPDGVRQEIYAHLIVHHTIRGLLDEAACPQSSTAEQTSFNRALHVIRRSVISPSGFFP